MRKRCPKRLIECATQSYGGREIEIVILDLCQIHEKNETGTHLPGSSIFCGRSSASAGVKREVEVDELRALDWNQDWGSGSGCWGWEKNRLSSRWVQSQTGPNISLQIQKQSKNDK